ncbi:BBIP1 protein, partial [Probosciger aterrimus]|nr:BBIP1 protein [Probosciger aterrimus]
MPEGKAAFQEVLPKQGTWGRRGGRGGREGPGSWPGPSAHPRPFSPLAGQLSVEDTASMVLCKPKVLPLKSVSLEKLEALQRAALEAAARQPEEAPQPPEGAPQPQP